MPPSIDAARSAPNAASDPRRSDRLKAIGVLRNRALATLMLGHFTVDMYVGILPVLYPLLTDKFDLNLKTVGLVSLAYSGASSLSQPIFGWIADRRGTRLIGLALMWTAVTFAVVGFAPTFEALVILAALSGLGSGLYHPFGALNARAVIEEGDRNTSMSIYVTGGTLGVASGPLIGAAITHFFGLRGTAVMVLPGTIIAVWMLFEMRTIAPRVARQTQAERLAAPPVPVKELSIVIAMMMLRAWTISGMQAFVPIWYKDLGYGPLFYSSLVTLILVATALGTVGSGTLADRRGRRFPLIASSFLSVPTILLFAQFPGWPAFVIGPLVGFLAASTLPLLLVIAQELMAGRAGVASGLILGLGFATSAIGVPITGAVADAVGLQDAMRFQALIGLASFGLAWLLPTEATIRRLASRGATAAV